MALVRIEMLAIDLEYEAGLLTWEERCNKIDNLFRENGIEFQKGRGNYATKIHNHYKGSCL